MSSVKTSSLFIENLDITADASLDGTGIEGRWVNLVEFAVFFTKGGQVVAGFTLEEEALRALYILLKAAIEEKERTQ